MCTWVNIGRQILNLLNFEFRPDFSHAQIVSLSQKRSLAAILEAIVHKVATK